ncbi:methionine aminopeptidase [Buchnera aphidicola (Nipponaphis monzeni)]|uniref:Methionine aminopeptidase n=1 Tax=Buchnera aphidicola (Nipponaphis monzeni) TaxID=2495405 RepID=A0A455TA62_9GAMM|nr:type I methionyl aminopeptidase [Buchnera aphidicola]BBI01195.1 methionine aminopeptidase [Buchnera aphidicola (Nipponaphis monzeni)]
MNNISIKNSQEIEKMRISGKLTAEVLEMIEHYLSPGITTSDIDNICYNYIINKQKAIPACLGYNGFPKSICTSVNNVVCHGIPNTSQILKKGDIINIDISIIKNGYHGDSSKMFYIGDISPVANKLCYTTQQSLYTAIKLIKPGIRLFKLGKKIQEYVEKRKFSVVREYCGHGIGKLFHEPPQILHYLGNDNGLTLKTGMTFTIEPMINAGNKEVVCEKDGWTIKTKDQSLSAQYEHTILVTENGCEILTYQHKEKIQPVLINE